MKRDLYIYKEIYYKACKRDLLSLHQCCAPLVREKQSKETCIYEKRPFKGHAKDKRPIQRHMRDPYSLFFNIAHHSCAKETCIYEKRPIKGHAKDKRPIERHMRESYSLFPNIAHHSCAKETCIYEKRPIKGHAKDKRPIERYMRESHSLLSNIARHSCAWCGVQNWRRESKNPICLSIGRLVQSQTRTHTRVLLSLLQYCTPLLCERKSILTHIHENRRMKKTYERKETY